jgi:hypothetical protein
MRPDVDWSELLNNVVGGVIAGLILLVAGFFLLNVPERRRQEQSARRERREQSEQAAARRSEEVNQAAARRAAYLAVIQEELVYDDRQRSRGLTAIRDASVAVLWPLFEVYGADILRAPEVIEALDGRLLIGLLDLYNRLRTANQVNDDYRELIAGPTAVLARGSAVQGNPALEMALTSVRTRLDDRLVALEGAFDGVLDALQSVTGKFPDPL